MYNGYKHAKNEHLDEYFHKYLLQRAKNQREGKKKEEEKEKKKKKRGGFL